MLGTAVMLGTADVEEKVVHERDALGVVIFVAPLLPGSFVLSVAQERFKDKRRGNLYA